MSDHPAPPAQPAGPAPLEVRGLTVRLPVGRSSWVHAVTDAELRLHPGEITVLAGESGGGKSTLLAALCGLLPAMAAHRGMLLLGGRDLSTATEAQWRSVRGREVALAPQSGATSFTPVRLVGTQLQEVIDAVEAPTTVAELLSRVGLGAEVAHRYPHELSGGMAQRVAVAAATAGRPPVLLADEPTAGLDPELTMRILQLIRAEADEGTAVLLVSHDLQAVQDSAVSDRLAIMYAGRIVEQGTTAQVLTAPEHPYTVALLRALPSRGLHPILGLPPELTDLPEDYSFADRLAAAAGGR